MSVGVGLGIVDGLEMFAFGVFDPDGFAVDGSHCIHDRFSSVAALIGFVGVGSIGNQSSLTLLIFWLRDECILLGGSIRDLKISNLREHVSIHPLRDAVGTL